MKTQLTCPQCGRRYTSATDRCEEDGSPLYGPEVMARIGLEFQNYRITGILGDGGMGVVYRAEHVVLGKPIAIKVLHQRFARRQGAVEQFLREARAASQIRHPNIVDVTDFGTSPDSSVFFVMEFLEGESLEDVLARDGTVPVFSSVNIVRQTAQALAAAHDHDIVHLDLKPDNVFLISRTGRRRVVRRTGKTGDQKFIVEPEGKFDFVKLLDFGVAKFITDNNKPDLSTHSGMVFGTPHYMSPEQARGEKVDGRSDIYSLGILFYEMVTGNVPFDGEDAIDILNSHVAEPVPAPKDANSSISIDDASNATILRCLEKRPQDRYQTMDELVKALEDCFTDTVFLRNAHRLPGAREAGIMEPNAVVAPRFPDHPEEEAVTDKHPRVQARRTVESRRRTDINTAERHHHSDEWNHSHSGGRRRLTEPLSRVPAKKS